MTKIKNTTQPWPAGTRLRLKNNAGMAAPVGSIAIAQATSEKYAKRGWTQIRWEERTNDGVDGANRQGDGPYSTDRFEVAS